MIFLPYFLTELVIEYVDHLVIHEKYF